MHCQFVASKTVHLTALEAWSIPTVCALPRMTAAMRLRDAISALCRSASIKGFAGQRMDRGEHRRYDGFFFVEKAPVELHMLLSSSPYFDAMTCLTARAITQGTQFANTSSGMSRDIDGRGYILC
jgi:hypothetical protein